MLATLSDAVPALSIHMLVTISDTNYIINRWMKICKRCSFECDMGKYSTRSINKVWAFRQVPIERVLYFHISHEKWATFVFSHTIKSHDIILPYSVFNLQLECDINTTIYCVQSTARVRYVLIPIYFNAHNYSINLIWRLKTSDYDV